MQKVSLPAASPQSSFEFNRLIVSTFIITLKILSWISFLGLIPLIIVALWLKNRSSVQCWVRIHKHPDRWLLGKKVQQNANETEKSLALQSIVEHAQNIEWPASCVYRKYDHHSGEYFVGLISDKKPLNLDTQAEFISLPTCTILRASGKPRDENVTTLDKVQLFCEKSNIELTSTAYSLTAQSFHVWEWPLSENITPSSFVSTWMEWVFEMRDIAFYPLIITPLTLAMLGTGNSWLFNIGIFAIILLSGSHKFVFLHQREDASQERHLQNY